MQMQHQFSVPVPVEVAWQALLDPERVAPCMPGATLTKAEGNEFSGSVKVKLGPVTLLYKGKGTFKEVDEEARRVVIDASGKDSRGSGTAAATVAAVLKSEGDSTAVTVDTDLKVTGKPAQLGRGLISEVGGKILNQFAANLAEQLTEEGAPAAAGKPEAAGEAAAAKPAEAKPAAAAGGEARAAGAEKPSWRVTPAGEGAEEPAPKAAGVKATAVPDNEAIDLLGTAGAPVLKRLAPAAIAVVALGVIFRLIRRRRRRRA
ncbi:SRPBCC family protein [Saccharopolyspora sp. WRP15-2]|uniref:SRPBCC family protein n=1 Tax=Saccharopolyspora oryzae TaxID=2997343 RepID=A0ABT4V7G2_9PSEU|nr:SRPBCC family protein [Saccharopolyspora oryzae]MDA3629778.1 SRPBCC family protein [Saccharopolyspora oryzae]